MIDSVVRFRASVVVFLFVFFSPSVVFVTAGRLSAGGGVFLVGAVGRTGSTTGCSTTAHATNRTERSTAAKR